MKLENLERVNEIIAEIMECEGMLAIAKSPDLELCSINFNYYYISSTCAESPRLANKRILNKLHDVFILELEREIAELKAELETL